MRRLVVFFPVLGIVFACAGSTPEPLPMPPPPPEGLVPVVPEVVVPPPVVDAQLLPPPWSDLGLGYGTATVLLVDPVQAILTFPVAQKVEWEALGAEWQSKLAAAGFLAGTATYADGDHAGTPWTKGEATVSVARGAVGDVVYLTASKPGALGEAEFARSSVDAVVAQALGIELPKAAATPKLGKPGGKGPRPGGRLTGPKLGGGDGKLKGKGKGKVDGKSGAKDN